jgi:hypothetical protein
LSTLAARVELAKLARVLGVEAERIAFVTRVPAEQIRRLREAVSDQAFDQDLAFFYRVARVFRRVPASLAAVLAERVFGPFLTARVAGEMPAAQAAGVAGRVSTAFVADACVELDPRRTRDFIRKVPVGIVVDVALEILRRGDFLTMGRFVDFVSDDVIRAVEKAIEDDVALVRVAYYVESRNRLDHLVRLFPIERLHRVIRSLADDAESPLDEILALVRNVGYALQRELGNLTADHGEAVLSGLLRAAKERDLWSDLLPVFANLSEEGQRKVVALPEVRDPEVLDAVVRAADDNDLWTVVLPLVRLMDEGLRTAVAETAARRPRSVMEHAAEAALLAEQWEPLLDIVARMPAAKQVELADIVRGYGEVDPELFARIARGAAAHGYGERFDDS